MIKYGLRHLVRMEETAYHEAGHAYMAHRSGAFVQQITIEPDWDEGPKRFGDVRVEWRQPFPSRRDLIMAQIQVALAGPAAEMVYIESPLHPAHVREWSLDWKTAAELAPEIVDAKGEISLLESTIVRLFHLFRRDDVWPAIAALADELLAHETLEWEQVENIFGFWQRHF